MKDTIQEHQFVNEMSKKDHGFSYDGAKALFEHLTQYEKDCDKELEFDPIAFRCEYSEYDNLEEVKNDYNVEDLEHLEQNTTVIEIPNSKKLIVQAY
jgi:hypothetical protein